LPQNIRHSSSYPILIAALNEEQIQRGITMSWAVSQRPYHHSSISTLMPAHSMVCQDGKISNLKILGYRFLSGEKQTELE
jgi:hypothetical protein